MMAAGARPERISGKAKEACSATSAKSHTIARPSRSRTRRLDLRDADQRTGPQGGFELEDTSRFTTDCRRGTARALASRAKTLPRDRTRKTRARGFDASLRSSASMASNITPVTSLPWLELSSVKVRTSAVRSITTSLPAIGLEATLSFLLVMAARYRRNAGLSNGAGALWIKEMSGVPIHSLECGERGKCVYSGFQSRSVVHFVVRALTPEELKNDRRLRSCHFALYTPLCPVQDGNKGSRHRVPIGAAGLDCGGPHPRRPGKARPK